MSASSADAATSRHEVHVAKWTADQTEAAIAHYGINPGALSYDHMVALGFIPEEEIHIDQHRGTVIHTGRDGQKRVLTVEEWNREP